MIRVNTGARFAPGIVEGPLMKKPARYTALPASGTPTNGIQVVQQNIKRISLILKNVGTGNVYISSVQMVNNAQDWPLAPGESLSWIGSDNPTAPLNAIFATGDGGHDLRVIETVAAPLVGNEWQG
jgi:hypothetical protein